MGFLGKTSTMCPANQHCSEWARKYMKYCLCSAKDGVSFSLGLVSVVSWGVAEIPQIITNYKEKSTEGLSIAFLMTWILGDFFNLFGCMLEPATLPTQYYMALLYTITTLILAGQSVYYGHIYPRLKSRRRQYQGPEHDHRISKQRDEEKISNVDFRQSNYAERASTACDTPDGGKKLSTPIPLPEVCSPGGGVYYVSARSLSSSHTPTAGFLIAQRNSPTHNHFRNSVEEPLLAGATPTQSSSPRNTKNMLCLASSVTILGILNIFGSATKSDPMTGKSNGRVLMMGRKLLQVNGLLLQGNHLGEGGLGTYLGWAMAAIYMGGRLPQICLNMRRGHVEGLNPLMFLFALIGNATYVASILVNSLDWVNIKPNLPWLVDAGGCVVLDLFILIQFMYFSYMRKSGDRDDHGGTDDV